MIPAQPQLDLQLTPVSMSAYSNAHSMGWGSERQGGGAVKARKETVYKVCDLKAAIFFDKVAKSSVIR